MRDTPMTRRRMVGGGLALAAGPVQAFARKPNVLFLYTDDQRRDTIRALGNSHIQTPNLDSLVKSGVSFTNAYCMGGFSAAVCLPSRMMALRGRSWFAVQRMQTASPNIAETFNDAGYVTYHLGKRGNEDAKAHPSFQFNNYVGSNDIAEREKGQPAKILADQVTAYLKSWNKEKPFFMYLADGSPHDPRVAPPQYLAKYKREAIPLPPNFQPFHPFDNGEMTIRDEKLAPWPRTESEIRRHLHEYYAVITYMDEQIGRVLQTLKDIGEYDNTIIVFSSDQGIAIGSHGLMGKQNLYQHSMNSALVFTGPGVPKGKSVDAFAYLFDIYPTLCELAGVKPPDGLEGKSQAAVVKGNAQSVRDVIFLAYRQVQRAVRVGQWKLIHYPKVNRTQLFDLKADPNEMRDLSRDPKHAARMRELFVQLRRQQQLYGDTLALGTDDPANSDPAGGSITLEFFN
ncbi:MAG: sulfatase-like hydrolase/transferase [Acidobacteria bacterium]|nr:sulfatase-like hydrolase/transferase [Acidobacteriota bacterium]